MNTDINNDKPPIIFIPGMMCDWRLFAPQIAALNNYISHDATLSEHDSIESMASAILRDTPPIFNLVGLSMGGIVAMEIARVAPMRVQNLALMDTNPLAEEEAIKHRRTGQIARVRKGELRAVIRDEMKPLYIKGAGKSAILDLCMAMANSLGAEVFINQSKALQNRRDYCDTLRAFNGRALVLHGADDRLCPPERHQMMHDLLPNSQYVSIKDAGHLPTLEQPDAVNKTLIDWLNG
ncbi:MAG: alpha/beta fold hydrolase [Candidatus Halichondribacter symbioticus]